MRGPQIAYGAGNKRDIPHAQGAGVRADVDYGRDARTTPAAYLHIREVGRMQEAFWLVPERINVRSVH